MEISVVYTRLVGERGSLLRARERQCKWSNELCIMLKATLTIAFRPLWNIVRRLPAIHFVTDKHPPTVNSEINKYIIVDRDVVDGGPSKISRARGPDTAETEQIEGREN